jgi:acetoin utilization protein AcuB
MLVQEIMTGDPATVSPQDSLRTAIFRLRQQGCRHLPVIEGDRLVGILSDRDIRRALNSPFVLHEHWQDEALIDHATVQSCMTPDPKTVGPQTPVVEAARLMRDYKIGGLPVVAGGMLVGIITETDMLDALIQLLEKKASLD